MKNDYASKKIVVIGSGLMGCGIAQVFATNNIHSVICDPIDESRDTALDRIRANLQMQGIDDGPLEYVRVAADFLDEVGDADFVIEAAPEKLPLKQEIFAGLVACTAPALHTRQQYICHSYQGTLPRDWIMPIASSAAIFGTHRTCCRW